MFVLLWVVGLEVVVASVCVCMIISDMLWLMVLCSLCVICSCFFVVVCLVSSLCWVVTVSLVMIVVVDSTVVESVLVLFYLFYMSVYVGEDVVIVSFVIIVVCSE